MIRGAGSGQAQRVQCRAAGPRLAGPCRRASAVRPGHGCDPTTWPACGRARPDLPPSKLPAPIPAQAGYSQVSGQIYLTCTSGGLEWTRLPGSPLSHVTLGNHHRIGLIQLV